MKYKLFGLFSVLVINFVEGSLTPPPGGQSNFPPPPPMHHSSSPAGTTSTQQEMPGSPPQSQGFFGTGFNLLTPPNAFRSGTPYPAPKGKQSSPPPSAAKSGTPNSWAGSVSAQDNMSEISFNGTTQDMKIDTDVFFEQLQSNVQKLSKEELQKLFKKLLAMINIIKAEQEERSAATTESEEPTLELPFSTQPPYPSENKSD